MAAVEPVAADASLVKGPVHEGHAVAGARLGADVADVVIDGALADRQPQADLLVGELGSHQFDDLQFPFREMNSGGAGTGLGHRHRPEH